MRRCLCGKDSNSPVLSATVSTPMTGNCCKDENLLDRLCKYIGNRCIFEFDLLNTHETDEITGILERIGCDYIELRTNNNRKIICSTDNLIFITIL
ncbi:MAG: hypothetical protein IJ272_06040 [Clostridia bacterium]|nr:hypothetical protein [Clostridia bacterium]